jgi:toxin CcdB
LDRAFVVEAFGLHPLEVVSVPIEQLGDLVGSLSEEGQQIIAAPDEPFSQAWK